MKFLDGDTTTIDGLTIAGLGGIIGNVRRPHRRTHDDYLATLEHLALQASDILLMHDGPDGGKIGQPGILEVNEILERSKIHLVIRGHAHWSDPFAELQNGLQVLNVDCRVVIMTSHP
jgi:Icc-related predicted phosphoesterase